MGLLEHLLISLILWLLFVVSPLLIAFSILWIKGFLQGELDFHKYEVIIRKK